MRHNVFATVLLSVLTLMSAFGDANASSNSTRVSLAVESVDAHGARLFGQWVELWQNGTIVKENFTPFLASVDAGTDYSVYIYDDPGIGNFFDHWEDGTKIQMRTIRPFSDATLSAFFNVTTSNGPPGGVNDFATTQKNRPVTINVLANDSDPNHDALSVQSIVSGPQNGNVTISPDYAVTYFPGTDFVGTDAFDYSLSDGMGGADTAMVSIAVNDTAPEIPVSLVVKSADLSGSEFFGQWVELWQNGAIVKENFTPFSATVDSGRQYRVYIYDDPAEHKFFDHWGDAGLDRAKAITPGQNSTLVAFFETAPTNLPPVAGNDSVTISEDGKTAINVLANDSDPNGDALSVSSVSSPSHGTAMLANNTVSYSPDSNFSGSDSFNYTVSDGRGNNGTGNISVTVTPVNDFPIATLDAKNYAGSAPVTIPVLANDSDPDGDALDVLSASVPPNGTAVINPDRTITYFPNGLADSDSFNYTITDGSLTGQSTVYLTRMSLEKIGSGLVASDPLNNATLTKAQLKSDTRYWHYGGSAESLFEPDAPLDYFQNSTGRYIGTQSPSNGMYAGYYAVAPPADGALFHAVITTPVKSIPGNFFQNGLYVQTADGRVNYVTCVSITGTSGTSWHVIRTFGNFTQATQFEVLWSNLSANQPSTRDCTIITDGIRYLKVYLDGTKVYESDSIDLQMPGPFLYFIEPQNSYGQMLYGAYADYYVTSGEYLTVVNLPDSARAVQMVGSDQSVILQSNVNSTTQTAKIDIGAFHFPISASLRVVDSNGTEILSTKNQKIYGGDTYGVTYPSVWKPKVGITWNVQLRGTLDPSPGVEMYAIDLFDNSRGVVDSLHANGSKAVCYFNAGASEDWRPDTAGLPDAVKGNNMTGFAGERWLDIRNIAVIGPVMEKRLDLCKQKGFDGADPDNVESYRQDTGFAVTYADQMKYNKWLADEAHRRGLSVGLKNDLGQVRDLVAVFDWGTNEQCDYFNECYFLKPFILAGKPVSHIEYVESGQSVGTFCPDSILNGFSGILKAMNLTGWYQPCAVEKPISTLRILTELEDGTRANGFFVSVNYNQTTKTGFSPTAIDVPSGHPITVQVSGFGNYTFDHWKDNLLTTNKRSVLLIDDYNYTAVYRNTSGR